MARGESLREAALRTGVSHTTIARIEKGDVTGSFHNTLLRIAAGYGVQVEYLLTGRDPRREFEYSIRQLPGSDRDQLYFVKPGVRIRMALDFLLSEYRSEIDFAALAQAIGWTESDLVQMIDPAAGTTVPEETLLRLADELTKVTGIPADWFTWGILGEESAVPPSLGEYLRVMQRASEAEIPPQMLEAAIDLLIARQQGSGQTKKR